MNRQMKRMQERQERAQKRAAPAGASRDARGIDQASGCAGEAQANRRTPVPEGGPPGAHQGRLADRRELVSYSIVVLVTITVLTAFVFGLDSIFTRFVFDVLRQLIVRTGELNETDHAGGGACLDEPRRRRMTSSTPG